VLVIRRIHVGKERGGRERGGKKRRGKGSNIERRFSSRLHSLLENSAWTSEQGGKKKRRGGKRGKKKRGKKRKKGTLSRTGTFPITDFGFIHARREKKEGKGGKKGGRESPGPWELFSPDPFYAP